MPIPIPNPPLFHDLLDPALTPVQICQIHQISLTDLTAIIRSEAFQRMTDQLTEIADAREPAVEACERLSARANLKQIATAAQSAADDIDPLAATKNPRLAHAKARNLETARKATTRLVPPRTQRAATVRERSTSLSPSPRVEDPPRRSGGGVTRSVTEGVSSLPPSPNEPRMVMSGLPRLSP